MKQTNTQLVIMNEQQAVTTSLSVAENFSKQHKNVLRDIESLQEDVLNFEQMFQEGSEPDSYGRPRKIYYMNRDGFTLLAMGFTGKEALQFKLKYIEAFNIMEEEMEKQKVIPLSKDQALVTVLRTTANLMEDTESIKAEQHEMRKLITKIDEKVETQITLDYGEQRRLQKAVATRVYELEEDPSIRPKLFREIYREIKDRFAVASYRDVKRQDLQSAINYIENFIPKRVS